MSRPSPRATDGPVDSVLECVLLHRSAPRVLVAEDDPDLRELIVGALRTHGYRVDEAGDGRQLFDRLTESLSAGTDTGGVVDVLVTDIRMPGFTGLEVLECISRARWMLPVVVLTAFGDSATISRARSLGANAVLDKPFELEALLAVLDVVLPLPSA